jgi:RNA polymerase sigma-70 factor (ECF subfamily)
MNRHPLDSVLEELCNGDPAAAERVFVEFEPYLRMVVRKKLPARLRARFDSMDIVQSVWADLLRGFREANWRFSDASHLRAFLVKLTKHRFIDRLRRHRTSAARECPLDCIGHMSEPVSHLPDPTEIAQADELWERMLALCPPAHRDVLRLRKLGVAVSEIASRTGFHQGSIHRILNNLACRVAAVQGPTRLSGPKETH